MRGSHPEQAPPEGVRRRGKHVVSLALGITLVASLLGSCGDQDVAGPTAGDFAVGIVAMTGAPVEIGWPGGNVLRVSVTRGGAPVAGALVALGEIPMVDRGAYYEPAAPLDFTQDTPLAINVRLPGFARHDTLEAPAPSLVIAPLAGADLRGCDAVTLAWRSLPSSGGAWILLTSEFGSSAAIASREREASSATITVPLFDTTPARLRVLSLTQPIDPFRPDRVFPAVIPPGIHRLAWSPASDVALDPRSPLEVMPAESLLVLFETAGDSVRIVWSPDTVRAHRLSVSTQFFAEGNLRWQIVSDGGFLPPVVFARPPGGSRVCAPAEGDPGPIQPDVEYFVEVVGRRHIGRGSGIPLAGIVERTEVADSQKNEASSSPASSSFPLTVR